MELLQQLENNAPVVGQDSLCTVQPVLFVFQ